MKKRASVKIYKAVMLMTIVTPLMISACASQGEKLGGISGISGPSAHKPDRSLDDIGYSPTFGELPKNQVPHTLLRKPVAEGRMSDGYGFRLGPSMLRLPRMHKGVDFVAPEGTAVLAAGDGVVVKLYVSKSYGNYIRIEHENGFQTFYAHLNNVSPGLAEGVRVVKGQVIGAVGMTGRASKAHLHYELQIKGRSVNPLF